jgi:hypothetical protein
MTKPLSKSLWLDESMDRVYLLAVIEHAQHKPEITELFIRNILIDPLVAAALVGLLGCRKKWHRVVLYHARAKVDVIVNAVRKLDNVERFRLSGDQITRPSMISELSSLLQMSTSLKELTIFPGTFTNENACILGQGLSYNKSLEEYNLGGCHLNLASMTSISNSMSYNANIQYIRFDGCSLEDAMIAKLVTALMDFPVLKELSLERNMCGAKGIQAISKLIHADKIEALRINWQYLAKQERFDMASIAAALSCNRSLHTLNVSRNALDDAHLAQIGQALHTNSTLQKLVLDNNGITDQAICHFASDFRNMGGLRKLWLVGNPFIGAMGARELLTAVQTSFELEDVRIPTRTLQAKELQKEIRFHARMNLAGRRLLRANNNVPTALWTAALARAIQMYQRALQPESVEEANFIYYILQGPLMMESR